jgi:CHAD domain-containing protein
MMERPLYFEFPSNLTVKKFLNKLGKSQDFEIFNQQYTIKTFYDSFDWRLYGAGINCELRQSKLCSELLLTNNKTGQLVARVETEDVPQFYQQFTDITFAQQLAPHLEMRALLSVCSLPLETYQVNILNKDQKTILRLRIDEYELLNNRIEICPLKGYEKAHKNIAHFLQEKIDLSAALYSTVLNEVLKQQGKRPQDYCSKLVINLKPDMRADKACKLIYKQLLQVIEINEVGTIANIDSEFLHDFRVAIRRTRAGLSQFKNTLTEEAVTTHASFFAWLGKITGKTRDLDVYLLSYPQYKALLPLTLQNDIAPLYDFLVQKQTEAQKELAEQLSSYEYRRQLVAWKEYLHEKLPSETLEANAGLSIYQLANIRIKKVYQMVLKEGALIDKDSPAEALHDLRKTCKKLRYLMEFFQSLYPEKEIKQLIKSLKGFQAILGDFQDYEVQELSIKEFSTEMMQNHVPANTLLAMGVLVQYLDSMKCNAREQFSEQFALFIEPQNRAMFKQLFSVKEA